MAKITHGQTDSPMHIIWRSMKQRCSNPANKDYPDYGGRGITVCDRWMDFALFAADMGERPPGMTLDRRENDKGYSPDNCRWATQTEQANNRRPGYPLIEWDGQLYSRRALAAKFGIGLSSLRARLKRGVPLSVALFAPPTPGKPIPLSRFL